MKALNQTPSKTVNDRECEGEDCIEITYMISPLFLLLEPENVLRGIGKPYVKSLDSRSDLRPDPPLWVKLGS